MFERIVVEVLLKYLGDYIKDLNREQLKIGLFSGNVVLKDLEVKGEAFESFNLPVTVKKGVLGKLELRVPWKNLKHQPVVVLLDNIFILVEKQNQFEYDEEEATRRKKNRKKKRLDNYEALSGIKDPKDDDKKEKSFSQRLVTKILDNLQILINKIHIRFEDEHEGKTFGLGLTIDRISLQSTDDKWKPTFVDNSTSTVIMKLVELSDLSIYMDTDTKSLRNLSHTQFYDTFSKLIPTSQTPVGHHFLIKPISAWLKLSMANITTGKIDMDIPRMVITAALEELSLSLEEGQYHALLGLIESINFYVQETKYLKFRPKERPTKDPRGWWKYAGSVVLENLRERLHRRSWIHLIQRAKLRREYIQLYKSDSGVKWHPPLSKAQAKRLEELDDQNTFEDIVFFRSLAKAELQQEAQNAERRSEYKKMRKKHKKRSRIIGALFSSDDKKKSKGKESPTGTPETKRKSVKVDKEQKKKEKEEQKKKEKEEKKREKEDKKKKGKDKDSISSPMTSPPSTNKLQLHVSETDSPHMSKSVGSDTASELASDGSSHVTRSEFDSDDDGSDGEAPDILLSPQEKQMLYETIGFDQAVSEGIEEKLPPEYIKTKLKIEVKRVAFSLIGKRPDATVGPLAVFSINDILVSMAKRPENMLLNLTVDNIEATDMLISNPKFSRLIARSKTIEQKRITSGPSETGEEPKFIQFRFEKNPLDGHADLVINATMSPLDIIINASSVVHFYTFFRPPQPVAVWALAGKGKQQWADIKQRTRQQMSEILKNKNTIDLTVDARAPTIFLPADSTQPDTVVAIADLGKIRITSELPDRTKTELDRLGPHESQFYDKFRFSVSGIRILATTESDQGWQDPEDDNYALYDFVHTDVNLLLEKSVNPHDTSLTQMKLSGDLPLLRVHFSTRKLGLVVQLANSLDTHLAPLADMAGGFKTQNALDAPATKQKSAKPGAQEKLSEAMSGVEEDERDQLMQQLLDQKQIEVSFSIGSVEVELCQTTDEGEDQIIAKLKLVGLSLDLVKQMYNLQGDVVVHGIQLQDFVTVTDVAKFKNLLYSDEDLMNANSEDALIRGSFVKKDKASPDFQDTITTLSFAFKSLYIAVNPPAIQTIMSLVNECISATTQLVADTIQTRASVGPVVAQPLIVDHHDIKTPRNVASKVKMDVTFVDVSILLNANGTHLATFSVTGIDAEVDVKENGPVSATAIIRDIRLTDETNATGPHTHVLYHDENDDEAAILFGFHKLALPPSLPPGAYESLAPHNRLEIEARCLQFIVAQSFLRQLLRFAIPLLDMSPARAVSAVVPKTNSAQKPKTYNTLVSPFQKKGKDPKKSSIGLPPVPEKKRMQLDIKAQLLNAFMPDGEHSRTGVTASIGSATLFTTFSSVGTQLLLDGEDEIEEGEEKEAFITVNTFAMTAGNLELHIVRADKGETTKTRALERFDVKMGMDFLFGNYPKAILLPSKTISIHIPVMRMATDPEKMGIVFRGIMDTVNFSKMFAELNPRRPTAAASAPTPNQFGFTPPASPVLGHSNPGTPRGNTLTPIRGNPSRNHLALLNKSAIKIDIHLQAIEVLAQQEDGNIFCEMELGKIELDIDIRETRNVKVFGRVYHMQIYDVIPAIVEGLTTPRRVTVGIEQQSSTTNPIVSFTVSKKKDAAAYVDLAVLPLYLTLDVVFFSKLLAYVIPLGLSFRYTPPPDDSAPQPQVYAPLPVVTTPVRPTLIPRITRGDTARELKTANSMSLIQPITPSPPASPAGRGIPLIRPLPSRREAFASERPQSVPSLPVFSPLRASTSGPSTPPARPHKQKSFFRLKVENTTILIQGQAGTAGSLLFDVGSTLVYNEMATRSATKTPTKSLEKEDEDDIAAETQVEQMRKLVVKTARMNARACDPVPAYSPGATDKSIFEPSGTVHIWKDAEVEINIENRDQEHERTSTVPKRRIIIHTSELLFAVDQREYSFLMSIAAGLLTGLVIKRAKPLSEEAHHDAPDSLVSEICIEVPDIQLAVRNESNSIAVFRMSAINFNMLQYASKSMKIDAQIYGFNIVDTRPGICTEYSRMIHGRQKQTAPMIKFKMHRIPATGTMNISFKLDHLRMYANIFSLLEILDFFLPAISEKLMPNFTKKAPSATKAVGRILSIDGDVTQMKLFVVSDFTKHTTGMLEITLDTALEFVDRNRDAKVSVRLQRLHIGTYHQHISSQRADVLHSASVDFVLSSSQGLATSITLSLDTLPLFLSPQDIGLILTIIADIRPTIPMMKSKFQGIRKPKEKVISKEVIEKEEVLVVSCIGGIIITAMNDHMGRALPMAEVRITQISVQLSNWSAKRMELDTNMVLLVEYFNSSIMAFEPLIEKWPVGFTLKQSANPKFTLVLKAKGLFNINVTHAFGQMLINSYDVVMGLATQASQIFKKNKETLSVSTTNLNSISSPSLTVTPSAASVSSASFPHSFSSGSLSQMQRIQSAASMNGGDSDDELNDKDMERPKATSHLLSRLTGSASSSRSGTPPLSGSHSPTPTPAAATSPHLTGAQPIKKVVTEFHPYWIYNQTGYSLTYLTEDQENGDDTPSRLGDRLRFPMENVGKNTGRTRNFRQSEEENSLHVTVRIPFDSPTPVQRVPIDALGCYFFKAGNNMQEKMCCEVSWNDDGSKNVNLRSLVVLRNHTDIPLEFRVSDGPDARTLGPQPPGDCFALPVQLAQKGVLMIRPSVGNFRTNDTLSLAEMHQALLNNKLAKAPSSTSRNLNLAEILDKTSSANVENKLLNLMNKTGLTSAPEKEEAITRTFTCMSQAKIPHLFILQITRGPAFKNNRQEHQMYINVYPPLILENCLPFAIQFSDPNNQIVVNLDSGAASPVYWIQPKKSVAYHLTGIPNFPTSKHVLINYETSPPTIAQKIRLVDPSHTHTPLELLVLSKEEAPGVYKISIYCSSWLLNNTQLPLLYKVPKVYEITDAEKFGLAPGQTQRVLEQVDEKPFLYAHDKLKIQVPGSEWSKKFDIDTVGKTVVVQMYSNRPNDNTEYRFRVSIRFGEGKFQRTKMITFSPHYIIVNLMSVPLLYRQSRAKLGEVQETGTASNTDPVAHAELAPGESTYFHWPNDKTNKHLIITRNDGNYEWSGPFAIDDVGDCTLKLRHRHKQQSIFPRAEVIDSPTSVFVLIHPEDPAHPPFIIENLTDRTIRYQQEGISQTDSLGPNERAPYAWDQPLDKHALLVDWWGEKGEHGRMRCKISKIVPFKPLKVEQTTMYGYMHVSGPTRVLTLTLDQQLYESQGAQWDGSGLAEQGEWDISINIPGIGISLVDDTPKELLYWSIHGISAMYAKSNIYTTAEVVFDFMQIDNQLRNTDYPVMLYHTKPKDVNDKHRPFLHFSFVRRMNVALNFFEYAGLLVQEINVMLEDSLLNSILDLVLSLTRQLQNNATFKQSRVNKADRQKTALYSSTPQVGNMKMIYFKLLHLNPIKVVLSFTFVPNGILSQSSNFLGNFGMTFGQLERAPICLNALLLEHPFTPRRPLVSRIKAHYIRQALNQLYKAVGSSETFGNPVGLFNNLGTGFKDFFYEPAQGFVRSPQEFGRGLAKGSLSLLKHSVYGLFNTISKITGAFGKGLALLSLDPEYLNHRRTSERKQPKHIGEGLVMGAQGLGLGIFDGVTGVVRKPIEGALHSGPSGFAKGVVQGVVGVAVKPAAGIMDLATKTTEGIKNTTNLYKDKRRVRPPRAFAKGLVLIEYTLDESEGRFILDNSNDGVYKQDDLLYNMRHGSDITVITNRRVMSVKAKNYSFIFQVPFEAIKQVEMVQEGVTLHFYELQPILIFLDRRKSYTIEIADKDQILLLCIMLRDCIRAAMM